MDLLKILRSLEEFIFEATTWLLFYPLTLWRIVRRPLATMDYSDHRARQGEQHGKEHGFPGNGHSTLLVRSA